MEISEYLKEIDNNFIAVKSSNKFVKINKRYIEDVILQNIFDEDNKFLIYILIKVNCDNYISIGYFESKDREFVYILYDELRKILAEKAK